MQKGSRIKRVLLPFLVNTHTTREAKTRYISGFRIPLRCFEIEITGVGDRSNGFFLCITQQL